MNTLNNYITEKLFVDTEDISSTIDRPLIIKTLESVLASYINCEIEINDKNEIIIKDNTLNLDKKTLKILDDMFRDTNYRIKYCQNISLDIYAGINTLPQWLNGAEVGYLEFIIHKPNSILQDMSFNLTNKYLGRFVEPAIEFRMINNVSLPNTKNIIFNNTSKKTCLYLRLNYGGFKFDELNYDFFKGIDIKGKKLENISLSYLKIDTPVIDEYIKTEIENNKELYNFYKNYSEHMLVNYRFKAHPIQNFKL